MRKVLNLAYPERSSIKFKIIKYPDGQQDMEVFMADFDEISEIEIRSRLNSFLDLELIICTVKAIRSYGYFCPLHLYVPYFLGSRSDRAFGPGRCNYLRDVICPIIGHLPFKTVTVLDPHSDVLEACLPGMFSAKSNEQVVSFALDNICRVGQASEGSTRDLVWIIPDSGAAKKAYHTMAECPFKGPSILCSKERGIDGKIIKTEVPVSVKTCKGKDFIIVDDICDGGRTFIEIAKTIGFHDHPEIRRAKIYLVVTHGIFSKGFVELSRLFEKLYCTNSYADIKFVETWAESDEAHPNKVKQLNIF